MKNKMSAIILCVMFLCSGCGYVSKFAIFAEYETVNEEEREEENILELHKEAIQNYVREELREILGDIEKMKEGVIEAPRMTVEELVRWRDLYHKHKFDCPVILEQMNEAIEYLGSRDMGGEKE